MSDDSSVVAAELRGKFGALEHTLKSAHKRMDKQELLIREDFKEIKDQVKELKDEIKKALDTVQQKVESLEGSMNRGKGWAAAGLFVAGSVGSAVTLLLKRFM
jgi:uncharacterized protein YlxW (UPF0749 family)